jgi:type VI secretion system protein ImpA
MIVVEELLQPISEDNPSGTDLRYDPVYSAIKEARRTGDELNQGAWQEERKVADYPLVISLSTKALKTQSKDLQIAAWLTEALLRNETFAGLLAGLQLCHGLIAKFWDTLYPQIDEGDLELRAAPLEWMGLGEARGSTTIADAVRTSPLNRDGHNWHQYNQSRTVGYEDQAKAPDQKKKREKAIAEGKLAPEVFDKSFTETPKVFYLELEKQLDASLAGLAALATLCDEKFGDASPSFGKLKTALQEVRHVAHSLLTEKRKIEPDPVVIEAPPEQTPEAGAAAAEGTGATGWEAGASPASISFNVPLSSESPGRRDLVEKVAAAAATIRQREPYNPAPYLMMRGLRWGDLRSAAAQSDAAMLEAPPTEIRQQIKRLALAEKWKELLETAEAVMALPCSRAWLDLQRFVVEACVALGRDYDDIAVAIRSELRCLLRDVPHLLEATLMDDTPAANSRTRDWLREILAEPAGGAAGTSPQCEIPLDDPPAQRWQKKFVDSLVLAKEALRTGQPDKAIEIMNQELSRQRSARARFQRRLQFVEICISAGKDAIVQPLLEDMIATIDAHKLEEWEDKPYMASALITIMRASKKIQADAKEKQKYFERVCRLDPAQGLNC